MPRRQTLPARSARPLTRPPHSSHRPAPQDGTAATRRAYLSNVCVAAAARRCGVGRALIAAAERAAAGMGVRHLYVHVVADNEAAAGLYVAAGFEVEAEGEAYARALQRPRRKILHKMLDDL
jgi:ribosomal protein S18 acetylase RimI-like enzyme